MQKAGATGLIPRKKLFGNPTRAQAKISPDGRWLSWLAPNRRRAQHLRCAVRTTWTRRASSPTTRKRGIRFHGWALDSSHVLYMQDEGGTEEWHIYAVDVTHGTTRDLTPLAGVTPTSMTWLRSSWRSLPSPSTIATRLGMTSTASIFARANAS